jgi:hypothetical protein
MHFMIAVIVGRILTAVYPVRIATYALRHSVYTGLESQLDRWYIDLPDILRFDSTSKQAVPPPHVLLLHVTYWSTVMLLHRAW